MNVRGWSSLWRFLVATAIAGVVVLVASPAQAAESINGFDIEVQVNADTTMRITETIRYDFGSTPRRGIIRDIPVEDDLPDNATREYDVQIVDVLADGRPVPYEESIQGQYLSIRIGDPDVYITGEVTYTIDYTVGGALDVISAGDITTSQVVQPGDVELYWDLLGSEWEVPISDVTARVVGPGVPIDARCFTGPVGSTQACPYEIVPRTARDPQGYVEFGPQSVSPYEPMTGAVAYPASAFTVTPQPVIRTPGFFDDPARLWPFTIAGIALGLFAPIVAVLVLRRRLRGVVEPLAPVQFGPPDDLRPAEIAAAKDGKVDSRALVATLLHLVARRHITMSSDDGGIFKPSTISLAWWAAGQDDKTPWENRLLAAVFKGQSTATITGYDATLAKEMTTTSASLTKAANESGRRNANGGKARTTVTALLMVALFTAIGSLILGGALGSLALFMVLLPLAIFAAIGLAIARALTPYRQTASSADFLAKVEGFKRFLDTDPGAARRELAHRLGLPDHAVFATMLPYAVVLDVDEAWTGAFPDITGEQLQEMGLYVGSTWALRSMITTSQGSMSSATTAPSSRSGGSGFGGGGFSGGGGGGGGGRSW